MPDCRHYGLFADHDRFVSIADVDGETQKAFMIYLLRCILPERADSEVCRKCRFVSGKFFDRLLAKIIEAHE